MTKKDNHAEDEPDTTVLIGASQVFRRKGFAGATTREIAAAAGMLPGSLHYRFQSKEDLLLALMERGITRATSSVRLAISGLDDPVERLKAALRAHLRLLLDEDEAIYVLLYEGRGLSGDARTEMVRLRDRYDALWDGLLHAAAGTGRVRSEVDLKLLRLLLLGAVNWTAQWFSQRGLYSSDEVADAYADIVLTGILVRPAAQRRRR
jgi:TetR/AcrR family transcriptional regulator, cholesterol catabolism regulator